MRELTWYRKEREEGLFQAEGQHIKAKEVRGSQRHLRSCQGLNISRKEREPLARAWLERKSTDPRDIAILYQGEGGFPGSSAVKNPPADESHMGSILGWGRSPGGGHGSPVQ